MTDVRAPELEINSSRRRSAAFVSGRRRVKWAGRGCGLGSAPVDSARLQVTATYFATHLKP
jgi:hypothetical protein